MIKKLMPDFNTLNYSEENINTHNTGDEFEQESVFPTDISDNDTRQYTVTLSILPKTIEIMHFQLVNQCFNSHKV